MSKLVDAEAPPSYQESTSASAGQDLLQRTTGARSQRVSQVVVSHILPVLSDRASRGLSKSIIALVPVRKTGTDGSGSKQHWKLVGLLASDENVDEIQLDDPIDTAEFWMQPETIEDLQRALTSSIASDALQAIQEEIPPRTVTKTSRFFFGRRKSASVTQSVIKKHSTVQVRAAQEDMCYRVASGFGLYETVTKLAIIVRVDIKA